MTAIFGAGMGVGLAAKLGAKRTVTIGMALETFGLAWVALKIGPNVTLPGLIPAILTYGTGFGFATAQLSNITLAEIPPMAAGVASESATQSGNPGRGTSAAPIPDDRPKPVKAN